MSLNATILLIEDEAQMRKFIRASLQSHGYRLLEAATAVEGTRMLTAQNPDIVLLDLGLPDGDGIDLTKQLREWSKTPIIVISARGQENDKVAALDAGADDYLTKPFGVNELLARIRVAQRHRLSVDVEQQSPLQLIGDLSIDFAKREVRRGDEEVHLTPTEYKILALLVKYVGKVVTHRQILKEVWGPGHAEQSHYVRVHMAELRKKIERDPTRPKLITTEPGVGYRLRYQ